MKTKTRLVAVGGCLIVAFLVFVVSVYVKRGATIRIDGPDPYEQFFKSLEFSMDEFKDSMNPEALIQAIETRSKINIPEANTSIDSLNKLLQDQDLYKVMKNHPDEIMALIGRLKQGQRLIPLEIRFLNRILIEANYPVETPKSRRFNSRRHRR